MIRINIKDLLTEKEKSKYWLALRMSMTSRNLNNIINGETSSISFKTMNDLCKYLECTPGELFTYIEEDEDLADKVMRVLDKEKLDKRKIKEKITMK